MIASLKVGRIAVTSLAFFGLSSGFAEELKDDLELVKKIHAKIVKTQGRLAEAEMKNYDSEVVKTKVPFSMVAIKGGDFLMGSPETEADRKEDEGPQRKVSVSPFWMGKHEVTWDEYEPFMTTDVARQKDGAPRELPENADIPFVVSKPTTPYTDMSFDMGMKGFPAISMTQHSALKYCQWLSAQTGHFYRLPTEAEWEYACRAGTTTAFFWGDDPADGEDFAWHFNNADNAYKKVGLKKPNPWGLHDMHGNVIEWCLDAHGAYKKDDGVLKNPYVVPGKNLYPRIARGGSWYDDPNMLRSSARFKSEATWKIADPQLPKSIWFHTNGLWLGFRLVRPLEIPSAEEMHRIWNSGRGVENQEE